MKVFFYAPLQSKASLYPLYQKIYKTIVFFHHYHLNKMSYRTAKSSLSKKTSLGLDKLSRLIQEADSCVFEASYPDLSLGYLIARSLELDKPTVILSLKNHRPFFLDQISHEKLIFKTYVEDSLSIAIQEAFAESNLKTDKRFNFFISPNLLIYLNRVSKKLGVTKSTFIRNLIEEYRKKNP
jgi:predicted DNA binding CopG/RHH family protein